MGLEHLAAVWEHSRQSGSSLVVLLAVASYSNQRGEWTADQATLQRRARLGRRRIQQILEELVAAGELAVVPGDGRGHRSTYRLTLAAERAQPPAPFTQEKGAADCTLPASKGEAPCTLPAAKGAAQHTLPAPPSPPSPPDPLIPPYPPEKQETSGLRPLPGPQSAVFRVNLLLDEAGVPLPSPAQIGLWSKTLGGIEPLLELLGRLIHSGLANKREPAAYIHRAVAEQAAGPTPRATRPAHPLRTAGVDDIRRRQAARLLSITPSPGEGVGEAGEGAGG